MNDTDGVESHQQVQNLSLPQTEIQQVKRVHIKKYSKGHQVKLFRIVLYRMHGIYCDKRFISKGGNTVKKQRQIMTTAMTVITFAIAVVISIPWVGCGEGSQITKPVITDLTELGEKRIATLKQDCINELSAIIPLKVTDNPRDFIGQVIVQELTKSGTLTMRALPNVTLTIVSGTRSGESVITDKHGQYLFQNVEGDYLHLRAEKTCYEPKEVIVHRSHQTTLSNGLSFKGQRAENFLPGDILLGHKWPELVQKMLKSVTVVHDLVYYQVHESLAPKNFYNGTYHPDYGIIRTRVGPSQRERRVIHTLLHEIAHAHQHAMVSLDGSGGNIGNWINTPEGIAFAEAKEKDLKTLGKVEGLDDDSSHFSSLTENAAETIAYYLYIKHGLKPWLSHWELETKAPNRLKWAEEWFGKQ